MLAEEAIMRRTGSVLMAGAWASALAGCATVGGAAGSPPHLDKVVVVPAANRPGFFVPTFYFTDPDGDADTVHRKVIAIRGHLPDFIAQSHFNIAAEVQKTGAVLSGGWACDPQQISTTVRAYITDRHGNRSNTVDYTVTCR
jgi:hypothetical protein